MINRNSSPAPGDNTFALSLLFNLLRKRRVAASFLFTLLCLVLAVSTASAQTRSARASASSEERSRRVNNDEVGEEDESDEADDARPQQNPLVRKTAITNAVRPGASVADRQALTNDIVIISRAPVTAALRPTLRAGATAANTPNIWPVTGPLSSGYGTRHNPFGGRSYEFHKGQDIVVPIGTPVMATADGVVVSAGWHKGYGNGIYIDHGNGIMTRYGHLSRIEVTEGQQVKRGQLIGLSGSTGRSTGPHLHYEVRIDGEAINPLQYLPSMQPVAPAAAHPTASTPTAPQAQSGMQN
ncbi:MAG: M23 family metallopeptidase [Acidobacteriota bacterium]|nr:M23 family metallopeptidase [Acidobacteriota bacterium]